VVDTGTQPIRYLRAQGLLRALSRHHAGAAGDHPALLSICGRRPRACEALLEKNGVKHRKPDISRLLVPPSEAAHLALEFVQ
jgi:hypothetical protein